MTHARLICVFVTLLLVAHAAANLNEKACRSCHSISLRKQHSLFFFALRIYQGIIFNTDGTIEIYGHFSNQTPAADDSPSLSLYTPPTGIRYLGFIRWSPMTPPMKRCVDRVTPSVQGSGIASFVSSVHLSRNYVQHLWRNRILQAAVLQQITLPRCHCTNKSPPHWNPISGVHLLILMQIQQTLCNKIHNVPIRRNANNENNDVLTITKYKYIWNYATCFVR
jgi:hypothetical protein